MRNRETGPAGSADRQARGAYGADDDIVDYILGITFEIWEQGGVELIRQYYAPDCVIYGLDVLTRGADAVVDATHATLAAFPDRQLIGENVVWSGNRRHGYYSSHRLLSRATNRGPTVYGPATGKPVQMTNIADCVVENGLITREWLVRDNMTLARQLNAEPCDAARSMAARRTAELDAWMATELERVRATAVPDDFSPPASPRDDPESFARRAMAGNWHGSEDACACTHAPYSVMHRSPFRHYSGRRAVFGYYRDLRKIVGDARLSVDHVASQPVASNGIDIAVRWTAAGFHEAELCGIEPTGRPLLLLGVTHWRCIADRIAMESTVFDELALLSQLVSA